MDDVPPKRGKQPAPIQFTTGQPVYPAITRRKRDPHTGDGFGIALLLVGAWFLIFPRWLSLSYWPFWVMTWLGFGFVALGMLHVGAMIGKVRRRR